ncbi:hypothetical protein AAJ76_1160003126 [Vairimorpha ceranae]|uniref:Uncharacterized protein n=1 Tax=Vairimorpha ceranae TaxID=40302 RepID=A0A0F9YMZ4_9MICR|nr:hypothetical protein AAJ76_1160003126 [Vairimorpha ceranae]KKO74117.1 hypothetical protein AAJ76_1160003126 [Vairimorpha ceranae]
MKHYSLLKKKYKYRRFKSALIGVLWTTKKGNNYLCGPDGFKYSPLHNLTTPPFLSKPLRTLHQDSNLLKLIY